LTVTLRKTRHEELPRRPKEHEEEHLVCFVLRGVFLGSANAVEDLLHARVEFILRIDNQVAR